MIYTSDNLFIDEAELTKMFSEFLSQKWISFNKLIKKLADIDYYYYLLSFLHNLPETIVILFLGFFAAYNLLKFNESNYGNKFYPIITSSMYPKIKPGSLVYSTKSDIYNVGDIVSYVEKTKEGTNTGKIFTHRIIQKDENMFILKGDANPSPDPLGADISQIQGKVAFILPVFGYIEIISKTLPGFLVFIAAPSIFLILRQFKEVRKNI